MEKREYPRLLLNKEAVFFINNSNIAIHEFSGIIDDISEVGIRIKLNKEENKEIIKVLQIDTELTFSTVDILSYNEKEEFKYISGNVKIVRIEELDNNVFICGCKIINPDKDILKYLDDKRTYNYLHRLKKYNNK